jgi:hypothetical protein
VKACLKKAKEDDPLS